MTELKFLFTGADRAVTPIQNRYWRLSGYFMKIPSIHKILGLLALLLTSLAADAQVIPYNFPAEFPTSGIYHATVDGTKVPALQTERGAILSFGMRGPVELAIKLARAPKNLVVRPLSAGIVAEPDGAGFRLRLPQPMNLSVEVDGNLIAPLLVFANPELTPPDRNDPKVKFFGAGHIYDAGEINLGDGETLYIEGGAVVRGVVRAREVDNVSIRGAGILDASTRTQKINMLVLRECHNAVIENLILLDPLGWTMHLSGSERVRISNTRVVGWRANSDGLDIEYSKNIQIDGCFWRTNDDCIAIKAIYPPGVKNVPFEEMINPETLGRHQVSRIVGDVMGDITISRCVLWNDSGGQGFEIGFELRIDEIRGITFRDSDIIHVRGGGAFTIHNGDRARIEDLKIENIRVEDTDRLIDFHVGLSIYSEDCPPLYRRSNPARRPVPVEHRPAQANNPYQWYIPAAGEMKDFETRRGLVRHVEIRNVSVTAVPKSASLMSGYSSQRGISDVTFEGLVIAGKTMRSAKDADIRMSEVGHIEFRNAN